MPSIAYPAPRVRSLVRSELSETFQRVAARGAARLAFPAEGRKALSETSSGFATAPEPTAPENASKLTAAPQTATKAPPAPTTRTSTFRQRSTALGSMEDTMVRANLGALSLRETLAAKGIKPTATQTAIRQAPPPSAAIQPYIGSYPTVQQSEEADWTTYLMIGLVVAGVGGAVWYAKKHRYI